MLIKEYGIEVTRHCESCHNPIALVSGALTPGSTVARPFDDDGVTCTVCHSIERVTSLEGIGSYEIHPPALLVDQNGKPFDGVITDEMILANVDDHRRAMMKDLYRTPEFCAACHKSALPRAVEEYKWRRAFSVYDEWQMSSHSNESPLPFYRKPRNTCQSCHMRPDLAAGDLAATNGKIASHRWPASNTAIPHFYGYRLQEKAVMDFLRDDRLGVDIFTLKKGPAYPTQRDATDLITLRKGVAGINLVNGFSAISIVDAALYRGYQQADDSVIAPIDKRPFTLDPGEMVTIGVVISNRAVGHVFPAELRDFFQPWVEFTVTNAREKPIYHSGFVRPDGEVEQRAHIFQSIQVTEQAEAVQHHNIWDTRGKAYDNYIVPGRSELVRYQFTIPRDVRGPIRVTARVRYRKFNRFYSNWVLGKSEDYPIVDMAARSITLRIGKNRPATTKLDEKDLIRFNNLGIALLDQLMFADARRAFDTTTEIDPNYADGYINQALASDWTNFPAMHALLDTALSLDVENARAMYYKGALLRMSRKPAEALEWFRRIEPKYPRDRLILSQMGECYKAMRQPGEALKMFERVLQVDPDDITALYFAIDSYGQVGAFEKSEKTRTTYSDKFEDWRIHYLANEYIKKDEDARAEAVPWHIHSQGYIEPSKHADPIYWQSEGTPRKKRN